LLLLISVQHVSRLRQQWDDDWAFLQFGGRSGVHALVATSRCSSTVVMRQRRPGYVAIRRRFVEPDPHSICLDPAMPPAGCLVLLKSYPAPQSSSDWRLLGQAKTSAENEGAEDDVRGVHDAAGRRRAWHPAGFAEHAGVLARPFGIVAAASGRRPICIRVIVILASVRLAKVSPRVLLREQPAH
jgi:hypothetical protein